jgi:hypothetical protein
MRAALKNKLDRIFSTYVRLRDSNNGYGRCISCGKIVHWKDADAGHLVNRSHLSLRWNEMNVNLQCRYCNRFKEGEGANYTMNLINKYGKEKVEYMLSHKHQVSRIGDFEAEQLIKYYQEKIKEYES